MTDMAPAQLNRLWTCVDQVSREDETGNGLGPSGVGLQCGGRTLGDWGRLVQAGIRDAICLFADHILIVRTPPSPGLGLALRALTRGPSSVVPHERIPIDEVVSIDIVKGPVPGWRLIGNLDFLRVETRRSEYWHWMDWGSLKGQEERFRQEVVQFDRNLKELRGSGIQAPAVGAPQRDAVGAGCCRHCGTAIDDEDARFCGKCGASVSFGNGR